MNADATLLPEAGRECTAPPSAILGFAAPIKAGKTEVSTLVAERLCAPRVSFGGYLRRLAQDRGLEVTRENLQDLGDELVRTDVRAFCWDVLEQQPWCSGIPLVIDGVRHLEVLNTLAEILSPAAAYLIYINVDRLTQEKRLQHDELRHRKTLAELEQHPTELQVRSVLPDKAALVLDGTRPREELTQEVLRFFEARSRGAEQERNWKEKNARRIQLAKKKNREGLSASEWAEFDQLQTSLSDYLDAKFPRTPLDSKLLDQIEKRMKSTQPPPLGD